MIEIGTPRRDSRPYWKRLSDALPWYALVIVGGGALTAGSSEWAREQVLAKGLAFGIIGGIAVGAAWAIGKLWAVVRAVLGGRSGPAQADATFHEPE